MKLNPRQLAEPAHLRVHSHQTLEQTGEREGIRQPVLV